MLVLKGHGYRQTVYAIAFAPDGASLASCSLDGTVRLWDLRGGTGQAIARTSGYCSRSLTFSPNGKTLAWGDRWAIRTYALDTGEYRQTPTNTGGYSFFPAVRYSPDGRTLAAADSTVHLWDAASRRLLGRLGDGYVTGCLAFSPDGRRLAFGHSSRYRHEVRFCDPTTKALQPGWPCSRQAKDLAFSPDGRSLAAVCSEYLTVWSAGTPEPVFHHKADNRHFQSLAFTPDGRFLAATHNDRAVRFWPTQTWREQGAYDWGIGEVVAIAFAADGMRAAAGGRSGRIVVWDVDL